MSNLGLRSLRPRGPRVGASALRRGRLQAGAVARMVIGMATGQTTKISMGTSMTVTVVMSH